MARKWFIRVIAILMALLMALSVLYVVVSSLSAKAVVTQGQIDDLKKQQKELEKKKGEVQSQINSLQYQQSTTLQKKKVLDDQILLTHQQISNITDQIARYDELISQKTAEVQTAQATEEARWSKYKRNLRTMEENGSVAYISVIFQANSFSDLLSRINDISEIMQYEQNLYKQLQAAKKATISAKTALQSAKSEQEADKAELSLKETELQKHINDASALLAKLDNDIKAAKELYNQEKKEADAIQADINKKTEELKKQQAHDNPVRGTGSFIWPVPNSTYVTSKFGMRYHPIYKEYLMHTGIDIGADYGVNIDAADDGTVIVSEYSSSYGNYIVIDHGNGMTTLYAHLSQRNVKVGAKVKQGQIIGQNGSTGNSTGPHLHFEISINGSRVNPLQFFTNYTLSPSA